MKRRWKNFRIDPNKVYMRIRQAVVYSSLYVAGIVFSYWAFLQRNDILGGGRNGRKQFSAKTRIREAKIDNGRITKLNTKNFAFVNDTFSNKWRSG